MLLGGLVYEAKAYGGSWDKDETSHEESKHITTDFSRLELININLIDSSAFEAAKCIEAELVFDLNSKENVRFKTCRKENVSLLRIIHPLTINYYILLPGMDLRVVTDMAIRFNLNSIKFSIVK